MILFGASWTTFISTLDSFLLFFSGGSKILGFNCYEFCFIFPISWFSLDLSSIFLEPFNTLHLGRHFQKYSTSQYSYTVAGEHHRRLWPLHFIRLSGSTLEIKLPYLYTNNQDIRNSSSNLRQMQYPILESYQRLWYGARQHIISSSLASGLLFPSFFVTSNTKMERKKRE